MKTIVFLKDGSIQATSFADQYVAQGIARYATPEEIAAYEKQFEEDDLRMDSDWESDRSPTDE